MSKGEDRIEAKAVRVRIAESDWGRMLAYCRAADPNEIIGLAHAEIADGILTISNPFILKQEVTGSTCEFDQKAFAEFLSSYGALEKVRCVWHSHVRMGAFFSSCDRETSTTLSMIGRMVGGSSSWFVSMVLNIEGKYSCRIDMYKPFEATLDSEIVLVSKRFDDIEKEVKEQVSRRSDAWERNKRGAYQDETYSCNRDLFDGEKVQKKDKDKSRKSDNESYSYDDVFDKYGMKNMD